MLKKQKNQENVIMLFFVVVLVCVGMYIVADRSIIDIIYFGVLIYYFRRFLVIRKRGK